ncbi:unnamed protein product [Euphydryas editha]|uniref:Uncharacterized protein n=1 Tax=Euphydryas editha TaxID=104508 RepID=A0AAU9V4R2_EUPED|nr:unnamed protein product [Euphydryas editha]
MRKFQLCIGFFLWIITVCITAIEKDRCEKCVKINDCPRFVRMTFQEKRLWQLQFPCDNSKNHVESEILSGIKNENYYVSNTGPYYPNPDNLKGQKPLNPNVFQNPYFIQKSNPKSTTLNNGNSKLFGVVNSDNQCKVQMSLPPDPTFGCCGQEMSDSTGLADSQKIFKIFAPLKEKKFNCS